MSLVYLPYKPVRKGKIADAYQRGIQGWLWSSHLNRWLAPKYIVDDPIYDLSE